MNSLTVLKLQSKYELVLDMEREERGTLTLPSSPLFATQPSTGRASVLLHCFKNSDVSTQNWERYLNAVEESFGIFIHNGTTLGIYI